MEYKPHQQGINEKTFIEFEAHGHRIVTSAVEHHAVLDSVEWLAKHDGAEITCQMPLTTPPEKAA
mgnify:CR=1 FL=1